MDTGYIIASLFGWIRSLTFLLLLQVSFIEGLSSVSRRLLILGVGRVGKEVMLQALESGQFANVYGVSRTIKDEKLMMMQWTDSDMIEQIARQCTHVLVTVPPRALSVLPQCENLVQALAPGSWLGVISTTGVYGDHNGAWVTEDSPCLAKSTQYIDYERRWRGLGEHCNLRIFRSAGIYGPNASALHTILQKGFGATVGSAGTASVTNRIHVEDLAAAVIGSMLSSNTNERLRIYNLADDYPESRSTVFIYAAELLKQRNIIVPNHPTTAKEEQRTTGRSRRRGTDQKRIDNKRMKHELLPVLRYPSYKEGLKAILVNYSIDLYNDGGNSSAEPSSAPSAATE